MEVVKDDPELTESARELFESGTVEVYLYDETIEPRLIIADARTMFLGTDEEGAIQGIGKTDDTILPWAKEKFKSLKLATDPVDPETATGLLTI